MQKLTGKNRAVLIKRFEQPYGLKVYNVLFKMFPTSPWKGDMCEAAQNANRSDVFTRCL